MLKLRLTSQRVYAADKDAAGRCWSRVGAACDVHICPTHGSDTTQEEADMPCSVPRSTARGRAATASQQQRSLLEQRAWIALADERGSYGTTMRWQTPIQELGGGWNSAALRAGCVMGLVLVAALRHHGVQGICATGVEAASHRDPQRRNALGRWPGRRQRRHARVRASLHRHQLGQPAAIQRSASGHHYTGHQIGQRAAIQLRASETFDWADASVGAGFAIMSGSLAGGVSVASRRRRPPAVDRPKKSGRAPPGRASSRPE